MEQNQENELLHTYEKLESPPDDDVCQICWNEKIKDEPLLACKRCKKSYHTKCLKTMLSYNKINCPNCRFSNSDIDFDFTNLVIFTPEFIEMQHIVYRTYYIARCFKISAIFFLGSVFLFGIFTIPFIK
jgi:E3 ubiquitin-protein ligase DOA10